MQTSCVKEAMEQPGLTERSTARRLAETRSLVSGPTGLSARGEEPMLCTRRYPRVEEVCWQNAKEIMEGAETHRAVHHAHRARGRMQRFSAMYTLSESGQGRGENALKWETFLHASSPLSPR